MAHPPVHASRSMISSGRVYDRPLLRATCQTCGYAFHDPALTDSEIASFYADDYTVDRGNAETDEARATAVVALLSQQLGDRSPEGILEIGCGAGRTLAQLALAFPKARAIGIEPASQLADAARRRSLEVHQCMIGQFRERSQMRFDLVYSVNVMEHVPDPAVAFSTIAELLAPGGLYAQITPDGEQPGIELLFRDHVSSFSVESLRRFAARGGLHLTHTEALEAGLAEFRLSTFTRAQMPGEADGAAAADTFRKRQAFLDRFVDVPRISGTYYVFGAGEIADLLNAYTPETIAKAEGFVVDLPVRNELHGKPVLALSDIPPRQQCLVAVHARSRSAVVERLLGLGHVPITLAWGAEV